MKNFNKRRKKNWKKPGKKSSGQGLYRDFGHIDAWKMSTRENAMPDVPGIGSEEFRINVGNPGPLILGVDEAGNLPDEFY